MKAYVKPELFYERYELSQHIADCAWEMNYHENTTCTGTGDENSGLKGMILFTDVCAIKPEMLENYCETNGAAGANTFVS